jgi:hypothetical protein
MLQLHPFHISGYQYAPFKHNDLRQTFRNNSNHRQMIMRYLVVIPDQIYAWPPQKHQTHHGGTALESTAGIGDSKVDHQSSVTFQAVFINSITSVRMMLTLRCQKVNMLLTGDQKRSRPAMVHVIVSQSDGSWSDTCGAIVSQSASSSPSTCRMHRTRSPRIPGPAPPR